MDSLSCNTYLSSKRTQHSITTFYHCFLLTILCWVLTCDFLYNYVSQYFHVWTPTLVICVGTKLIAVQNTCFSLKRTRRSITDDCVSRLGWNEYLLHHNRLLHNGPNEIRSVKSWTVHLILPKDWCNEDPVFDRPFWIRLFWSSSPLIYRMP